MLESLRMGLQVVVLPKFDLEKSCRVIQDYGITYASVPPPVVLALAKHPVVAKYDLSSVKWMNSGAAPLGKDLVSSALEVRRVGQGGLTIMSTFGHSILLPSFRSLQKKWTQTQYH